MKNKNKDHGSDDEKDKVVVTKNKRHQEDDKIMDVYFDNNKIVKGKPVK